MKSILYLWILLTGVCATPFSFAQQYENESLEALPSHWSQMRIKEPVFGGLVHVVETGTNHKETIILVHGLGYSGLRDWIDVIPHLEKNYHVVALDLPGFGESDSTSLQLAPQRYAELLKWLTPQFSKDKVTLVGHSMGGAISLRFASEFPDMLDKLIMVDTAGILNRTVFVRHLTQMPDRYEWLAQYQQRFKFVDSTVNKVNRFLNRISGAVLTQLDKLPDPTLALMHNEFAQKYIYKDRPTLNAAIGLINEDFSEAIYDFLVPTHIIWGELDRVTPVRTGELLASQLINAELHVISNAGHVPMKDNADEFLVQLDLALQQEPVQSTKFSLNASSVEIPTDLICTNTHNQTFSGHYKRIIVKGCKYLTLKNITAESIHIESSDVTMTNVSVVSDKVAMIVKQSFVSITNAFITGINALQVNTSTVDAAGVTFVASGAAVDVIADSLVYLSVSKTIQGDNILFLHGISQGNQFVLR
ncbi:MAG: alpha/beta hydrolase [Paraglaciecola sp.]|uniref:alpha/beta fold hydrolase n=1 Tax=Paraglaciecola sp. TaxID=1920173 RepID=UPI00329A3473